MSCEILSQLLFPVLQTIAEHAVPYPLPNNAPHPGVRIQHVWGGVSTYCQHLGVRKDIVRGACKGQVLVLDPSNAEDARLGKNFLAISSTV